MMKTIPGVLTRIYIYNVLAKRPGVARRKNNKFEIKKNLKGEKFDFFTLCHLRATHECPQKISAHSVQLISRL